MKLFHSIKIGLSDIYYIWRREYRAVFHDLGIVLFFFALPFAYPIVYAAVYNPEVVREVPMVVVDNARTPLSSLVRWTRHRMRILFRIVPIWTRRST